MPLARVVQRSAGRGKSAVANIPVGAVMPFGGASAPADHLLCQGQAVSRTTYADLFAVIGTTYGAGDGATTFNLPDLRERVPIGRGTRALGTKGGTTSHTHSLGAAGVHSHAGVSLSSGSTGVTSIQTGTAVTRGVGHGSPHGPSSYTPPSTGPHSAHTQGSVTTFQKGIHAHYIIRAVAA